MGFAFHRAALEDRGHSRVERIVELRAGEAVRGMAVRQGLHAPDAIGRFGVGLPSFAVQGFSGRVVRVISVTVFLRGGAATTEQECERGHPTK